MFQLESEQIAVFVESALHPLVVSLHHVCVQQRTLVLVQVNIFHLILHKVCGKEIFEIVVVVFVRNLHNWLRLGVAKIWIPLRRPWHVLLAWILLLWHVPVIYWMH